MLTLLSVLFHSLMGLDACAIHFRGERRETARFTPVYENNFAPIGVV